MMLIPLNNGFRDLGSDCQTSIIRYAHPRGVECIYEGLVSSSAINL